MTRPQALVDISLALIATLLAGISLAVVARAFQLPMLLLLVMQAALLLLAVAALVQGRGQRWADIGLVRPQGADLGRGALLLLLIFAMNIALTTAVSLFAPDLVEAHHARLTEVARLLGAELPFAALAATMLLVGFYEELVARGLLLQRCQVLLGGFWGPVLVSSLLFGAGHFYQGWAGVAQTTLVGVLLAYFVRRWGSLWPAIVAHAGLNTLSLAALRFASGGL